MQTNGTLEDRTSLFSSSVSGGVWEGSVSTEDEHGGKSQEPRGISSQGLVMISASKASNRHIH